MGVSDSFIETLLFIDDSCVISVTKSNSGFFDHNQHPPEKETIMYDDNTSSKDQVSLDCDCQSCHEKAAMEANKIKEIHKLRNAWIDVREQVWKVYHLVINSCWNEAPNKERPDLFKIKKNVHDLCARDPHQLYQRLEAGVREFVLEMKLRLIELLQRQAKNPSLAQDFIQSKFISYNSRGISTANLARHWDWRGAQFFDSESLPVF